MNYIDANIFVYAIINNDNKGEVCRNILREVAFNKLKAFTSYLTWDEVIYVVKKEKNKDIAIMEGSKLLSFPNLNFIRVDKQIIFLAQKLIKNYNLNPRDSIHAATALIIGAKEIISDDQDFDVIKEIKRITPVKL